MKTALALLLSLVLVGCKASPPKDAAGHVIGSLMGDAAPAYVAGQPIGPFLKGKWLFGAVGPNHAAYATHERTFAQSLTFEADGGVVFAMQGIHRALIARKGAWRLDGTTLQLTFSETQGTTDDPLQVQVAKGMSDMYASTLQLAPGARVLAWSRSAAAARDDPSQGEMAWLRVWP